MVAAVSQEERVTPLFGILAGLLALALLVLTMPALRARELKSAALVALLVMLASVGLYALIGAPKLVPEMAERQARIRELAKQITTMKALLSQNPANLEAWLTLGQAYMDNGDYVKSAEAFKEAVLISKGHPRIIMAYAEALILNDKGVVNAPAKKSIDMALLIDPALPLARYYNAVWLLQENQLDDAMAEMKKLYAELPEDSSLKKRMKAQIGK